MIGICLWSLGIVIRNKVVIVRVVIIINHCMKAKAFINELKSLWIMTIDRGTRL